MATDGEKQSAIMCEKCGTVNSVSNAICSNCGASLKAEIVKDPDFDVQADSYRHVWKYGVAIVGVVLIFALITKSGGVVVSTFIFSIIAALAGIAGMIFPRFLVFWTKKKTRPMAALYFALASTFFVCFLFAAIKDSENSFPASSAFASSAEVEGSTGTSSSSAQIQNSQTSSSASTSTVAPSSSLPIASSTIKPNVSSSISKPTAFASIKGSSATDLKLDLQQWGFTDVKSSAGPGGKGFFYTCTANDSDTGNLMSYSITAEQDFSVASASFFVANTTKTSADNFSALCDGYLGFCATMPYDAAQQAKAKSWVEENMAFANTKGHVLSIVIGDAKFELYGVSSTSRVLEISKAK